MRVNEHVYVLEIKNQYMTIYPTVIKDQNHCVLIDTGVNGDYELFREAFLNDGLHIEEVTEVIFTHHDGDHIGGANAIKKKVKNCIFSCFENEKPFIDGEYLPFKRAGKNVRISDNLTDDQKIIYNKVKDLYIGIDKTYQENDRLPYGLGTSIIYTPGHTPEHISLYLKEYGIIIAGDSTISDHGKLLGPDEKYTFDMDMAYQSLNKFVDLETINMIVCYHGGIVDDNPKQQLEKVIQEWKNK